MVKTICKNGLLIAAALIVIAAAIWPAMTIASAQLSPVGFGFPSVFHNAETTAFNRDILNQFDNEAATVNFGSGPCGFSAFPTITQTSSKGTFAESTNFYHTEETDAFNCPFVSTGGGACGGIPFGLGSFLGGDGFC
ncbi:MAG TPA: hypothetical protein VK436_12895 [Methanocella sp.]|nr:hypothetical protein [Methanocella sp.]